MTTEDENNALSLYKARKNAGLKDYEIVGEAWDSVVSAIKDEFE